jgi:peptidoglycan/LPS O-acetylase OafA/YrhL
VRRQDIDALTGLRGVAALWVFLFHAEKFARGVGSDAYDVVAAVGAAGYLGVDIFFVLSGFILAYNYAESRLHEGARRYGEFLCKRLARIYPVHLCALLLLLALQGGFGLFDLTFIKPAQLGLDGLLATLTLTHGWSLPIEPTWNLVSWSISCEWAAYLVLPWIALLASRLQSRALAYALIPALFVLLALFVVSHPMKGTMAFGLPRIAAEFTAGVVLYRVWTLRKYEQGPGFDLLALAGILALIPFGDLLARGPDVKAPLVFLPAFACALVYGLAAGTGPITRALGSAAATFAGRISYSFYLLHGLILDACTAGLKGSDLADGRLAGLVVVLAALVTTTLLSAGVYRWCEVPARHAMIRMLRLEPGGSPVADRGGTGGRKTVAQVPHDARRMTEHPQRT